MKIAIIAITKGGAALARRISGLYPGTDLYLPKRFFMPGDGAKALTDYLKADAARLFKRYRGLVFIMATGIVVRLIAPLVKNKLKDPAIVVMDEKGRYAISLLSGHVGGANELARTFAGLTRGRAVITTASDVQGTLAVDTLSEALDCEVEDFKKAKVVTAQLVNGGKVAGYSSVPIGKMPGGIRFYKSMDGLLKSRRDAAIVITPRILADETLALLEPVAVLRPKTLVVGIGCNKGTSEAEIGRLFVRTLKENKLSPLSVKNIATISEKRDEPGLLSFADSRGLKLEFISRKRLLGAATPSGRSPVVFKNMGVYGVCEPAALLSAGAERLLVKKVKSKNVTLAVAEAALP